MKAAPYVGRFAPSPTGPLHRGSLVAAMGSYLDARAHGGQWLLRIEDLDPPREAHGATAHIVATLAALGFRHDGDIVLQSNRSTLYRRAMDQLAQAGLAYPCGCTRKDIDTALLAAGIPIERHHNAVYPGTCRHGLPPGKRPRAWRVRVSPLNGTETESPAIEWADRTGDHHRDVLAQSTGDFVLKRADGWWAYQLAVVVDDADQGVTDVVRGADLIDSTARQIHLQRLLKQPTPRYLHLPLVLDAQGEKLSKQTGATALEVGRPIETLNQAMVTLGLPMVETDRIDRFWPHAISMWAKSRQ